MAGNLSDEVYLKSAEYRGFREKVGPERFDAFVEEYKWLDQGEYIGQAAPAFVFMQFATQERFWTPD